MTKIPFFRLFERVSESGRVYYTGYLGDSKVVIFKDEKCEAPRFNSQAEWQAFLSERGDTSARKNDRRSDD